MIILSRRLVLLLIVFSVSVFADPPSSFSRAKKIAKVIFTKHKETLYCKCTYSTNNKVNLASCGMRSADEFKRAHQVEWEHMVPASYLGQGHPCWTQDLCTKHNGEKYHGRTCCRMVDKAFRRAEAELYNLWPADGLINQLRDNYEYASVPYTGRAYGCNFIIDKFHRRIEPGDNAKGVVARATLFVTEKYHLKLSEERKKLFHTWNTLYPPKPWEIKWAKEVAKIEGYTNPYIEQYHRGIS